jgi:hypothetical protein
LKLLSNPPQSISYFQVYADDLNQTSLEDFLKKQFISKLIILPSIFTIKMIPVSYGSTSDEDVLPPLKSNDASESNFIVSKRGVFTAIAVLFSLVVSALVLSQSSSNEGLRQTSFANGMVYINDCHYFFHQFCCHHLRIFNQIFFYESPLVIFPP